MVSKKGGHIVETDLDREVKTENLSQEEVADKLNVTRQTVSKWETNQSTPDFDKIVPLCELFEISTDELLKGEKKEENNKIQENYAASDNMEAAVPEAAVSEASIETNIEDDKIESVQDYDKAVPELAEESTLTTKKQGTEELEQDDMGNFPSFESSEYTIINDFPPKQPAPDTTDNALIREEYCYKVPEKGTYFYHHELKEAIAYYCGQEDGTQSADMPVCAFQVVVDIFGDQIIPMAEENTNQQNAQEQQSISKQQTTESSKNRLEYAMLSQSDDGKKLLEQEYRRLAAAGYQVVLSTDYKLTGLFTKEELDHFQASSEYGYAFRFESEL